MPDDLTPDPAPHDAPESETAPDLQFDSGARPGFSAAELSAAARVIEHQVKLATERFAPKPA